MPLTADALRRHHVAQAEHRLMMGAGYRDHGLVCSALDGSFWVPDRLSDLFASTIKRLDLPRIRFHDLRHTHVTHLLREGVHPKIVSERLGHASVAFTMDTYSHILPDMQAETILPLDGRLKQAGSR
jgi:integrase